MPVSPDSQPGSGNRVIRDGWLLLGMFCVALGVIGAIFQTLQGDIEVDGAYFGGYVKLSLSPF
jgi:hypothetical protein